jgi:hypothetical protein
MCRIRHPRESGGPLKAPKNMDSRLRGNDDRGLRVKVKPGMTKKEIYFKKGSRRKAISFVFLPLFP